MKAQVSFEFMLYLVVAALALSTALFLSKGLYSNESALEDSSAMSQFVADVNFNMQYVSSTFYAYVPPGLCDAMVSGRSIIYGNATYRLYNNVSLSGSLCPAGIVERLSMSNIGNGTYLMDVIR